MQPDDFDVPLSDGDIGEEALSGGGDTPPPTVLIVDDDSMIRESLELLLQDSYKVILAGSAMEAIDALNDDIHVAVLDIKMKGQDGFWACEQIRKRYPRLPVIFYSAYQDIKNPYDIINDYHPFGYITKGEKVSVLQDAVERAVKHYRLVIQQEKLIARLMQVRMS